LEIERAEMIRVMHEEHAFSGRFLSFLLALSMRIQADLVDQLFNSSEKRLARILLLMAEIGKPGNPDTTIPKISQETLAEMIGTTRSRVSFFMNRFRNLGFIHYNGGIQVHKSLLNVVLLDQLPGRNAAKPPLLVAPRVGFESDSDWGPSSGRNRSKLLFACIGGDNRPCPRHGRPQPLSVGTGACIRGSRSSQKLRALGLIVVYFARMARRIPGGTERQKDGENCTGGRRVHPALDLDGAAVPAHDLR